MNTNFCLSYISKRSVFVTVYLILFCGEFHHSRILNFSVNEFIEFVPNVILTDCNRENDSLALVELFLEAGGTGWNYEETFFQIYAVDVEIPNAGNEWEFDQPISTWHGVKLNEEGCVELLALDNNGLEGQLVDLNLPELEVLSCQNNKLNGSIPEFSNLHNLVVFNCNDNLFSGAIPNFQELDSLKQFRCSSNKFENSLPNFNNLQSLEVFDCSNNKLSGSIPDFDSLSKIQYFYCDKNKLSGSIPNFQLDSLKFFSCSSNDLSGSIPNFSGVKELRAFICASNNLSGPIPDFDELSKLTTFNCIDNELTAIPDFKHLPNLVYLYCNANQLEGSIPDFLDLKNLQYFHCASNHFSDTIPDFLGMESLISFRCQDNELIGSIPTFSTNKNLEILNCNNNQLSGSIPEFSNFSSLKYLDLSFNNLEGGIPNLSVHTNLSTFKCSNNLLSGCFPTTFNYCNIAYDFSKNTMLPWEGEYLNFCLGENQLGAMCNDNNDNTINDLIEINCDCIGLECEESLNYLDTTICVGDTIIIGGLGFYEELFEEIIPLDLGPNFCDSIIILTLEIQNGEAYAGESMSICSEEVELIGNLPQEMIGEWNTTGSSIIIDSGNYSALATELENGVNTFIWSLTSLECPNFLSKDTIEILFNPFAPIASDDQIFTTVNIPVNYNLLANDSYNDFDNTEITLMSSPEFGTTYSIVEGVLYYKSSILGEDTLKYQICDKLCGLCSEANIFLYKKELTGEVNTAISPNGDGINDFFEVPGVENFPKSVIEIYNIYGSLVFKAKPYENNWSGNNMHGKPLPEGTYYYVLQLEVVTNKVLIGSISIKRE